MKSMLMISLPTALSLGQAGSSQVSHCHVSFPLVLDKHTLLGGIALSVGLGGDERGKSQRGKSLEMHDY